MHQIPRIILIGLLNLPLLAGAAETDFSHKDWELVCDNTLTCRAAGYENKSESNGSVLLTRAAGPNTPVTAEVVLSDLAEGASDPGDKLTLLIDGKSQGSISLNHNGNWILNSAQTQALIKVIIGNGKAEFHSQSLPFVLSGAGATAVLVRMDDVQGRLGTPGALVKKGNRPETSVLAAAPMPIIKAAKTIKSEARPLTAPEIAALKPKLISTLSEDDYCDRLIDQEHSANSMTLTQLDDDHALIQSECWLAAYNYGSGFWVIDSKLEGTPQLVTVSGSDYSNGMITERHKGRGLGDCWGAAEWVWDGQTFQQTSQSRTGACRYLILGGTWYLPSYTAKVIPFLEAPAN